MGGYAATAGMAIRTRTPATALQREPGGGRPGWVRLRIMTTPSLTSLFATQSTLVSAWLTVGHPLLAEAAAHAGYDLATPDLQHGAIDEASLLGMLQACHAARVPTLVRVAWNDPARIMKALDLGASGIIVPMVESADDVRAFVAACRYPPQGTRSYGPTRAKFAFGDAYPETANDEVVTVAMIETRAALEDLDALLSVPGLDMVLIGPADLSQALGGRPGADFLDGPVPAAIEHVLELAAVHGVGVSVFAREASYARTLARKGVRIVVADSDVGLFTRAAKQALATVRGE